MNICKSSAYLTDDQILQQRTLDQGRISVKTYKELLETIHSLTQKPTNEAKQKLINYSRTIAQAIQELVQCAEKLKGKAMQVAKMEGREKTFVFVLGADFIDPDDPAHIAETELFNAAQSIESAAKKLSGLKPRRKVKVNIREDLSLIIEKSFLL